MNKLALIFTLSILIVNASFGQFIVSNTAFQPTGVSNQGLVAGYETQAGPYYIWNPDLNTSVSIGGLAPGNGVGGQIRFSGDGAFLCGTSAGLSGAEISVFSQATQQWTPLGGLGFVVDNTVGGGFDISGDGNTVVGLSWADTSGGNAYAHAVAWNQSEGIMDLGSLYDSIAKSTRANAVSFDGSVVVGWQDFNGPWKSAVWRKNPAGGYFPNEYLLIDTMLSATDEFNQLGECSAVSGDGIWIGGYGDYANNNQPWIWSQSTGVINLGSLPNTGQGFVSGINADGTIVTGWFNGMFFGDPQIPFIWTPADGLQNLNDYISSVWGISTGAVKVSTASCMSSNGQYIAGYGIDTTNFNFIHYRVSANPSSIVNETKESLKVSVNPNPFDSRTTLVFAEAQINTRVEITGLAGNTIQQFDFTGKELVLERGGLKSGVYFLRITDADNHFSIRKIVIQ
ncbi:MAG: T9SS type A sorting domain-containing protein [Bacteroidia bacterium]|nr:T9SS type A sorting domain-containing protein [Bacteroidia bacterium]